MKIMTFNTQGCRNYLTRSMDIALMAETIKKQEPDIVGLNEMRGEGPRPDYTEQVQMLAELTGMPYYYFGNAIMVDGTNPYGNGLLSKYPIESVEKIIIPDPVERIENGRYETRCVIKAKIKGLTVLISHFGLERDEQLNAVKTVVEHLETENCIFMGDLNMTPDDPLLLPIQERMQDTAILFGNSLLSFPSDAPTMKIDYIFISPDLKAIDADIPAIVASDHRPHTAVLDM